MVKMRGLFGAVVVVALDQMHNGLAIYEAQIRVGRRVVKLVGKLKKANGVS
jgi:hypothetical protein